MAECCGIMFMQRGLARGASFERAAHHREVSEFLARQVGDDRRIARSLLQHALRHQARDGVAHRRDRGAETFGQRAQRQHRAGLEAAGQQRVAQLRVREIPQRLTFDSLQ
jgi:hypothetical protein